MAYKNKQITIRLPIDLVIKITNEAWLEKVSRNKVIENILLRAFDLPEELPSIMVNVIYNKLSKLEIKLEQIMNNFSKLSK